MWSQEAQPRLAKALLEPVILALRSLSWYNFSAPAAGNGTTSFIRLRPQLASQLAPLVQRLAYRRAAALLPFCSLRLCFHGGAWACPMDTPSTARKSRPRAPLLLRPQRCRADLVLCDVRVGSTPLPLPWPPQSSPQPPQPQPCLRPYLALCRQLAAVPLPSSLRGRHRSLAAAVPASPLGPRLPLSSPPAFARSDVDAFCVFSVVWVQL